ncbi:amino acid adenylation domain-containing protein [Echinicola sp. CAU 1574]|uniref:Amino acid adenylation domain-containing protein n=1 Tax=Echinicola arenosa TaxID=2774144 RepID=A0ABR9AFY7_9BACT|nr:polyketide synthase [Echinicola arenosa]MBD8487636.1 amino acid adenylation domain-containing protein [Echinicola arenosa]
MNLTPISEPCKISLLDLLKDSITNNPLETAITFNDKSISYQTLEDKSNQLAHFLIHQGVKQGDNVPICIHRSIDMIIGIIAIIKCGASYVPIAPEFPVSRIKYIINSINAPLLLADQEELFKETADVNPINLVNPKVVDASFPIIPPCVSVEPSDIAYILFTSGSTGEPKGVSMSHSALVNLLLWQKKESFAGARTQTLQFSKFTFDVSFQEIFSTLITGGTLHLIDEETVKDPFALLHFIDKNRINRLFLPFVSMQSLAHAAVANNLFPSSLKEVFTAGEQLKITDQVKSLFSKLPESILFNQYGPTEAHVVSQLRLDAIDCQNWPILPSIGFPIDNTELFVLNDQEKPVNNGEEGELCISGTCLAKGYLNRPDLTDEKFTTINIEGHGTKRIYKTGDIAQIGPNDEIVFLGRKDDQVKIRGHRIELGEIETVISKLEDIYQVAVLAKTYDDGQKYLAAYYSSISNKISQQEITAYLAKELPEYMIPSVYLKVQAFPKTTSGKIDRKSLPDPINSRQQYNTPLIRPKTKLEKQLAEIFQKILHFDRIGLKDNFFEFGGNSLMAQKLSSEIKINLDLNVPVTQIYQSPTIQQIIDFANSGKETELDIYKASSLNTKDIAVVGLSGRFPGANDIDTFWQNLVSEKETISHFSKEELDDSIPEEIKSDPNYIPSRGIIEDVNMFDPSFFGLTPNQAALMDPQQRLFLEITWELLEKTRTQANQKGQKIGVFAGTNNNTYFQKNLLGNPEIVERYGALQLMTLNEKDYISTRTAYQFDLTGPAISVYSACSTSLLAVAQAVQSIRSGQCHMAIAGGSTITSPIKSGQLYQEGAIFSKDGHCRPFDENASGTMFSDGAGAIMLKDLDQAIQDGDKIYATIKGIGINNDGNQKGSFSAPSAQGQSDVIVAALKDGNISPDTISYVETHGTATPLGDPIEIEGLKKAFGNTEKTNFCGLGSIKSNLGHLTAAAGITGLIKTVLSLHNKKLPASLGFSKLNPAIDIDKSPFYIHNKTVDWVSDLPLRAGVSSFGIGGTNVHVILEEYSNPVQESDSSTAPFHLINISAKSEKSLDLYWSKLEDFVKNKKHLNLDDLTYSINTKSHNFQSKSHLVFKDKDDLLAKLCAESIEKIPKTALNTLPETLVFLFPGQGAQYLNMGRDLYESATVFREAIDHCSSIVDLLLDRPIMDIIYPNEENEDASALLKNTKYTQPAIFIIEYALAKQWMSWGVTPTHLCGHSIGEFVAAHLAGIISLEDALKLVTVRGQLVANLPGGDMLSVRSSFEKIKPILPKELSLAALNSPNLCVIAGESKQIEKFSKELESKNILFKKLFTSHAFHSTMMDPILQAFHTQVSQIKLSAPNIPVISTVTGKLLKEEEACSPQYWTDHLRNTVLFSPAIEHLLDFDPQSVFLEVGPGKGLSSLLKQHPTAKEAITVNSLERQSGENEYKEILDSMGQLASNGININWEQFYSGQRRALIEVPTYAFDKRRCWIDPKAETAPLNTTKKPSSTSSNHNNTPLNAMRKETILSKLQDVLEDASGMPIKGQPSSSSFLELGLDSLLLTQLSFTLKKEFGIPLSFRQLNTEFNTLESLTNYLDQELPADKYQPATNGHTTPSQSPQNPSEESINHQHIQPQQQNGAVPAFNQNGNSQSAIGLIGQQLELLSKQIALLQGQPSVPHHEIKPIAQATFNSPQTNGIHLPPKKNGSDTIGLTKEDQENLKKPFGATARIEKKGQKIGDKPNAFIAAFIQKYTLKTASSKTYTQKNRAHMADPRVVSGFNPAIKELVYSLVVNKSKGSRLWDIDGNEYLDILNGFGSVLFGHGPDFINQAIKEQMDKGYEIGPQHELSGEVCKLVCEITEHERSALCNTGSEAVMGALRVARTVTQRSLVVAFNGSYHGTFDEVIVRGTKSLKSFPAAAGIMPESVGNILVLDYGTDETLKIIEERKDEIAAVLVEPVQSRRPEFRPVEFLKQLRKITASSGSALIFDEVITGFRMHPKGAQGIFDIKADIATYGKVVGGGLPIGVIAGSSRFMDALDGGFWQYGDNSVPEIGVTYFAGTFVRHPLALATAKASLEFIKNDKGQLQIELDNKIQRLADSLNAFFEKYEIPAYIANFGSLWKIKFKLDIPFTELLFATFREKGLHIYDGFPCFATAAYQDADISKIIEVVKAGFTEMATAEFWDDLLPKLSKRLGETTVNHMENNQPPVEGARLGKTLDGKPAWFIQDPDRPGKYLQLDLKTV